MSFRSFFPLLVILLGISTETRAEQVTWEMDSFSFFHSEEASAINTIPIGNLPAQISQTGRDTWSLVLPIASIAPVSSYGGVELEMNMPNAATGSIQAGSSGLQVQMLMIIRMDIDTTPPTQSTLSFAFTTGRLSIPDGQGGTTVVAGVPLDPASGFVQMVATESAPGALPLMGGKPFYVILSGRLVGLPASITSQ